MTGFLHFRFCARGSFQGVVCDAHAMASTHPLKGLTASSMERIQVLSGVPRLYQAGVNLIKIREYSRIQFMAWTGTSRTGNGPGCLRV
jgi:hypothetical protein